tara:strand:+ start:303 stop:764 length:462 start_codon:yes stop_codon:yes gene_type:complete
MSKEMKLIMESWRRSVLTEQEQIQTFGQLRKVIRDYRAMKSGKAAGIAAAELAVEQIPVLSNIYSIWSAAKDAKEMIAALYGSDDSFVSQTGLDKLNVDDDVSKIVDDKIENAFINDFLESFKNMDDAEPIPDINVALQDFLSDKFNRKQVKP